MKRTGTIVLFLGIFFLGCSEPLTTREKGAGIGTLAGASLGGVIGSATGHTGAGAAIGAGVGALSGGLIGNEIDQSERKTQAQLASASVPVQGPLSLPEVAQMAQQGISDSVIIVPPGPPR